MPGFVCTPLVSPGGTSIAAESIAAYEKRSKAGNFTPEQTIALDALGLGDQAIAGNLGAMRVVLKLWLYVTALADS